MAPAARRQLLDLQPGGNVAVGHVGDHGEGVAAQVGNVCDGRPDLVAQPPVGLVVGEAIEAGVLVRDGGAKKGLQVGGVAGQHPRAGPVVVGVEVGVGLSQLLEGLLEHLQAVVEGGPLPFRQLAASGSADLLHGGEDVVDGALGQGDGAVDDVPLVGDGGEERRLPCEGRVAEIGVESGAAGGAEDSVGRCHLTAPARPDGSGGDAGHHGDQEQGGEEEE